ncbi:hypothetical protein ACIOUE_01055 [Streptomyces xanthochromogenes]|uniref:hypothetical protein n=1 Tax=Streptomyces xanthochromogenes TaxID=67384 RepID=UPI003801DAE5
MGELGAVVRGTKEGIAAITAMDKRLELASLKALKASQSAAKSSIKAKMRGRPRWDHRGKSSRTGASVRLNLSPHHVSKSGGPGRLTGRLSGGIGGVRRPKPLPEGGFQGGVGAGGKLQNLYKRQVEDKYPYIKPGVRAAEPKMAVAWEAAWARAIRG